MILRFDHWGHDRNTGGPQEVGPASAVSGCRERVFREGCDARQEHSQSCRGKHTGETLIKTPAGPEWEVLGADRAGVQRTPRLSQAGLGAPCTLHCPRAGPAGLAVCKAVYYRHVNNLSQRLITWKGNQSCGGSLKSMPISLALGRGRRFFCLSFSQ